MRVRHTAWCSTCVHLDFLFNVWGCLHASLRGCFVGGEEWWPNHLGWVSRKGWMDWPHRNHPRCLLKYRCPRPHPKPPESTVQAQTLGACSHGASRRILPLGLRTPDISIPNSNMSTYHHPLPSPPPFLSPFCLPPPEQRTIFSPKYHELRRMRYYLITANAWR